MLNLYKLSITDFDYDMFKRAIVAAKNEDAARLIHPSGDEDIHWVPAQDGWIENCGIWGRKDYTWINPDQVTVKLVGTALPNQKPGVIMSSFYAG